MKNGKKLSLVALLGFALTICLSTKTYADSLVIENDYSDLQVEQAGIINRDLAIKSHKLFQAPVTTVVYSPSGNPLKSKVIFRLKDLLSHRKQGFHETEVKIGKKRLKVSYFCDIKYSFDSEHNTKSHSPSKKKHKKSLSYKFKKIKNKVKQKVLGNKHKHANLTDVHIKILSAHLDGKELSKVEK